VCGILVFCRVLSLSFSLSRSCLLSLVLAVYTALSVVLAMYDAFNFAQSGAHAHVDMHTCMSVSMYAYTHDMYEGVYADIFVVPCGYADIYTYIYI